MPDTAAPTVTALRDAEYVARRNVNAQRHRVYDRRESPATPGDLALLDDLEGALADAERRRREAQAADVAAGVVLDQIRDQGTLGAETTGLEARLELRMEYVPTAIAHLMTAAEHPLIACTVRNATDATRRLRVTAVIEGFSAPAIESAEIKPKKKHEFLQLPALLPAAVHEVTELTRAALTVLVEDIGAPHAPVELHRTVPIWLLARTSVPLLVADPVTGGWIDMAPYLGAFVTPNAAAVMSFLRTVAEHHPDKQLVGYQGVPAGVDGQVQAMFDALKAEGRITYINSLLTSSPEEGFHDQRVRLPRESLADGAANCIDGAVLYASLLEAASMHAAIAVVPGHAFVAYESWDEDGEWRFLETTMTGSGEFAAARESGDTTAERYRARGDGFEGLRLLPIRRLRAERRITPME